MKNGKKIGAKKRGLPGVWNAEELHEMMTSDAYFNTVILKGELPWPDILLGLVYILVTLCIDEFLKSTFTSLIIGGILLLLFYANVKP